MKETEVKDALKKALQEFWEKDICLLGYTANERSITHRLAIYLEKYFSGYDVDCEYNRAGEIPKRIMTNCCEKVKAYKEQFKYRNSVFICLGKNNARLLWAGKELEEGTEENIKKNPPAGAEGSVD